MKVVKFGGSSVADATQILKIAHIIKADADRRIVVVSAPGKRFKDDSKVTDLLIDCATAVLAGNPFESELKSVVARYAEIQQELKLAPEIVRTIENDLRGRIETRSSNDAQFMDTMKASGEDNNAKIIAEAFVSLGIQARYVNPGEAGMLLSNDFGNAQVLDESYEKLAALAETTDVIVFPGFFGCTQQGEVATFPRGGSDISGAILAAAIKADVYENFTDVDSVYAMDPRLIDNPPAIQIMTYREMRELSYAGFGVFHDEAIVPAVKAAIPICIKNTNRPDAPGTMVVPTRKYQHAEVAGIASASGFAAVYIDKYMMNREVGFGRRLLQIFEEEGISFEHTPSGIDNMSVIVRSDRLTKQKEEALVARVQSELQPDAITVEHGLSLVMVVGEGMQHTFGMASRACNALAEGAVNIEMINQGASEISIMFGIKDGDRQKAVKALGHAFFG